MHVRRAGGLRHHLAVEHALELLRERLASVVGMDRRHRNATVDASSPPKRLERRALKDEMKVRMYLVRVWPDACE